MLEAVIGLAAVALLIAGFWWTRGGGGMPGGVDDPAAQSRFRPFRVLLRAAAEEHPRGEPAPVEADEAAWQREREQRERHERDH